MSPMMQSLQFGKENIHGIDEFEYKYYITYIFWPKHMVSVYLLTTQMKALASTTEILTASLFQQAAFVKGNLWCC